MAKGMSTRKRIGKLCIKKGKVGSRANVACVRAEWKKVKGRKSSSRKGPKVHRRSARGGKKCRVTVGC